MDNYHKIKHVFSLLPEDAKAIKIAKKLFKKNLLTNFSIYGILIDRIEKLENSNLMLENSLVLLHSVIFEIDECNETQCDES